jgi:hypothetical protein
MSIPPFYGHVRLVTALGWERGALQTSAEPRLFGKKRTRDRYEDRLSRFCVKGKAHQETAREKSADCAMGGG